MKNNKTNVHFILEIFWLILAILTAIMGIHAWLTTGLKEAGIFFLMTLLCFLLYLARKAIRNKQDKK